MKVKYDPVFCGLREDDSELINAAEAARVESEETREGNETTRQTQEGTRQTNETARATAEGLRVTAESSRVAAGAILQTQIKQLPGTSTTDMMSQDIVTKTFESDELTTAESIAQLRKELDGIKSLLTKFTAGEAWIDALNVMTSLNFYGETNLLVKATVAPIPDFKGQFFLNLSTGVGYMATGTTAISDWKQIT